jgi:outer membrane protein TolC
VVEIPARCKTSTGWADEPLPPPPDEDRAALIAAAIRNRPEVAARRLSQEAAARFAAAERALWLPAISLVGAAGLTLYHETGLTNRYSALGLNVMMRLT